MCVRHFNGQTRVKLNPLFLYHETSGGRDGGSTLYDNILKAQRDGIPRMSVWGREHGFRKEPSDEAKADATFKNGVLTVTLPKVVEGQCRRTIKIEAK